MRKNEVIRSKLFPDLPNKFHFFTVAEVAIIIGTSTKKVHEWISEGTLRSFRIGPKSRLIRISYMDLEKFIDEHIRTGEIKIDKQDPNTPTDPAPSDNQQK
ncbi:helix-turn-helix domain-containing protein [Candidatus Peregrinibacteria bacterium]|nr:helix-turn-helix domain-containing protein [Candidatus Peregrinibacteria bacterium]